MGHEPVLIPDETLIIQLVIFMASYLVLRFFVLKPYSQLLELRRAKTTGMKDSAVEAQAKALAARQEYEEFLRVERKKMTAWTEDERKNVDEERKALLQKSRSEVNKELEGARAQIATEVKRAETELSPKVKEFSGMILKKLLGSVTVSAEPPSAKLESGDRPVTQ